MTGVDTHPADEDAGPVLAVLLDGALAGTVTQHHGGRLSLSYDDAWRATPGAVPISLSMPLAQRTHHDPVVRAFLWGLLPDNEQVLERWARTHQVSARNPFALLRHVGEDCAGAVQFTAPDRVAELLTGAGGVDWIDEEQVADRIRVLRRDPAAWHVSATGQFSLAGAQAKTALHFDPATDRWGDPWGAVPTTHILKPAVTGFDEHDLNEHLCLKAAGLLGMPAAVSRIATFNGERVIVVERYDRVRAADGTVTRVHQEDLCQALGLLPTAKYQNEGGPGPEQIIGLIRRHVQPTVMANRTIDQFVDALAFNWLIAGTDAHAKNYSFLLAGATVRLAPGYDIASALPYDDMYPPKLRTAMRIGGEYRIERIAGRHWRRFAVVNDLDADAALARVDHLAAQAPAAFARSAGSPAVQALGSELPGRLVDRVTRRAGRCRDALRDA